MTICSGRQNSVYHNYRSPFSQLNISTGLGVTNKGTQDETTTKLFSIHIPALLPPTAVPLELDHLVQTAAIAGLGLVYIGSAHRRMAEILLDEIGRAPGLKWVLKDDLFCKDCHNMLLG